MKLTGQTSNPAAPCSPSGTRKNHPGFKERLGQPCLPSMAPCSMHNLLSWTGSSLDQQGSSVNAPWSRPSRHVRGSITTKFHLYSFPQWLLGPLPSETPTLTLIDWPRRFSRPLTQAIMTPDKISIHVWSINKTWSLVTLF